MKVEEIKLAFKKTSEAHIQFNLYGEILQAEQQQDSNISNMQTQVSSVIKYLDDAFAANAKAQDACKRAMVLEKELGQTNGSTENKLKSILATEKKLMGYRSSISNIRK